MNFSTMTQQANKRLHIEGDDDLEFKHKTWDVENRVQNSTKARKWAENRPKVGEEWAENGREIWHKINEQQPNKTI